MNNTKSITRIKLFDYYIKWYGVTNSMTWLILESYQESIFKCKIPTKHKRLQVSSIAIDGNMLSTDNLSKVIAFHYNSFHLILLYLIIEPLVATNEAYFQTVLLHNITAITQLIVA